MLRKWRRKGRFFLPSSLLPGVLMRFSASLLLPFLLPPCLSPIPHTISQIAYKKTLASPFHHSFLKKLFHFSSSKTRAKLDSGGLHFFSLFPKENETGGGL